jgi:hypothetical protein
MSGFLSDEPDSPPTDPLGGLLPGTTGLVDPHLATSASGIAEGTGVGPHGITPMGGAGMGGAITDFWQWLNRPFTTPLSLTDIFLIVGAIIVAIILWNMILFHIRVAAEAL